MNHPRPARTRISIAALALLWFGGVAAAVAAPAAAGTDEGEFSRWARQTMQPIASLEMNAAQSDLTRLRSIIGDSRIVLLGESQHFAREPLAFRNRVFKYLVEQMGFTAIFLESGITESRVVHDYVLGAPGDLSSALSQGISWTFDLLPQNAELVRWMRDYNADPRHPRKLQLYGIDVAGSLSNPTARRSADTALNEALRYLQRVDPGEVAALKARLAPVDPFSRWSVRDYLGYPQPLRDAMTAVIAETVSLLERRQFQYVARSSATDHAWAYRNAIAARQVDDWMHRIPVGAVEKDFRDWAFEQFAVRDRAMFDNAQWALDQLGPDAKVLIFGALGHNANAPWVGEDNPSRRIPFGAYLKQRYGREVITIGHTAVAGSIGGCDMSLTSKPMPAESATARFESLDVPLYYLDLRRAPASARWLRSDSGLWNGFESTTQVILDSFDVLFFSRDITPACTSRNAG